MKRATDTEQLDIRLDNGVMLRITRAERSIRLSADVYIGSVPHGSTGSSFRELAIRMERDGHALILTPILSAAEPAEAGQ